MSRSSDSALNSAVTFLTAHDEAGGLPALEWGALPGTVVAFMALTKLDEVATRMLSGGHPGSTPVAIVSEASLPTQRVLRTTLGACTLDARRAGMPAPALVVIGEAAALAGMLDAPLPEQAAHA